MNSYRVFGLMLIISGVNLTEVVVSDYLIKIGVGRGLLAGNLDIAIHCLNSALLFWFTYRLTNFWCVRCLGGKK